MKKQALTLAIAAALSAPSALAAQDTSGMRYTSAAEGFYASIRVGYEGGTKEDSKGSLGGGPNDDGFASRIGVRGSNDLGGGLEGFYQWEAGIRTEASGFGDDTDHRNNLRTRLAHVGVRGSFGQIQMGSFWTNDYNWTHGSTDVANVVSGNFNYTSDRQGRTARSLEYTTPDLNGFQGAVRVVMDGGSGSGEKTLDAWNLAGTYSIQGFTVAGAYNNRADALTLGTETADLRTAVRALRGADFSGATVSHAKMGSTEDAKSWTLRLGYAQDNWYVNGWYGVDNTSDLGTYVVDSNGAANAGTIVNLKADDTTTMSLAGGISLDKVNLYAVYDKQTVGLDNSGSDADDVRSTIGVQYNLGANSRVWLEYALRDTDSDKYTAAGVANPNRNDNSVNVGLRHDF